MVKWYQLWVLMVLQLFQWRLLRVKHPKRIRLKFHLPHRKIVPFRKFNVPQKIIIQGIVFVFSIILTYHITGYPIPFIFGTTTTKYAGNPIFTESGSAHRENAVSKPCVILVDTTYYMYYIGVDSSDKYTVCLATSPDGVTWTDYGSNPILSETGVGWESVMAYAAWVIKDGATYHMWYTGSDAGGVAQIGYASSNDGITWVRGSHNPILSVGTGGSFDDTDIYAPTVVKDGATYRLWYTGYSGTDYKIGYATSTDPDDNWSKSGSNPVISPVQAWEGSNVLHPSVVKFNSIFHMYYTGISTTAGKVGYARSTDGVTWVKDEQNPIIDHGTGGEWDDVMVYATGPYYDTASRQVWLYYTGKGHVDPFPREIGLAYHTPPCFFITTTAEFDAGTKSQADGNYEVETGTENPLITTGQIKSASKEADNLTIPDVGADNWKGTPQYDAGGFDFAGASDASADIASGVLSEAIVSNTEDTEYGYVIDDTIDNTGDWTFEIGFENFACDTVDFGRGAKINIGKAGTPQLLDFDDMATIYRQVGALVNGVAGYIRDNGITVANPALVANASTSGKFRIRKSGTTCYLEYDLNGGWVELDNATCANWPTTLKVSIALRSRTDYPDVSCDITYYKLSAGSMTSPYRTSFNYESDTLPMTAGQKLKNSTFIHSGLSATYYIDKIEWLVGGVVKATYDTNITSGTSTTIAEGDLTSGTFNNVNANYTVKVYGIGDGDDTFAVSQVEGECEAISSARRSSSTLLIPLMSMICRVKSLFR